MKTVFKRFGTVLLILIFCFMQIPLQVRAGEKAVILTKGNEEEGYTYLIQDIGTFETNCEKGGNKAFVYVEPAEGLEIVKVLKDGEEYGERDGIFVDKGE